MKKLAWHFYPKHMVSSQVGSLCCMHEDVVALDKESTQANDGSREVLGIKETFGQRLKGIIKKAIPKAFQDKVGYLPLRKWVHEIDVGNKKPLWKYGRPLTPVASISSPHKMYFMETQQRRNWAWPVW